MQWRREAINHKLKTVTFYNEFCMTLKNLCIVLLSMFILWRYAGETMYLSYIIVSFIVLVTFSSFHYLANVP